MEAKGNSVAPETFFLRNSACSLALVSYSCLTCGVLPYLKLLFFDPNISLLQAFSFVLTIPLYNAFLYSSRIIPPLFFPGCKPFKSEHCE